VRLELHLSAGLPPLLADAVLVEQVVINLVRNASDALQAQPDGRVIEIRSLSAVRGVTAAEQVGHGPDFLRVEVSDSGPGLEGRRIEALCAPFYSTKREGMGMGLAICRSIIEAHQGVLDAGPSPLGGARFSFSLPLQENEPQENAVEPGNPLHD
jgi:two-component system sensor histidine kinase DctS